MMRMLKRGFMFCILLVVGTSFLFANGVQGQQYGEAPSLAKLVEEGKLPPVDERLPENPKVVNPQKIGQYGGTIYMAYKGPEDYYNLWKAGTEGWLAELTQDMQFDPSLATKWKWNEDHTSLTIYLRKGLKWSDGADLTAEDFVYTWETALDPNFPFIQPRDFVAKVSKLTIIDDYTFKADLKNPQPNTMLASALTYADQIAPKHYLKQFDPRSNEKMTVQDLEKAWSQERITEALVAKPQCGAWKVTEYVVNERIVAERNPYYHKVDSEGNQLPYIDRIIWQYVGDITKIPLLAKAGKISLQGRHIAFKDYTTYKTNEKEGGYRTIPVKIAALGPSMKFNYAVEDKTLRQLFWMKDFRWALSLATNREEIGDKIYFGQVEPWGPFAYRMSPLFPGEEYVDMYKNYDPQKANELLDGLGVKDTDGDGIREADGKPIQIVVDVDTGGAGGPHGVFEIVSSQWKKIGVDLKINTIDRSLLVARWGENAQQAYKWETAAAINPLLNPRHWAPTIYPHGYGNVGEPIAQWIQTEGQEGVEPPEFIKEYAALIEKASGTVDPEEQIRIGKEAMKMAAENVYFLSTTDYIGIVIADAGLENVPDAWLFGNQHKGIWSVRPDQVFYK